jgi:membrane peptidoglycan carboxypeptidase
VKDLRHIVVAAVFEVALLFLIAQAAAITATAWAENPQSGTACSFQVKPEMTPLSEISPYYIDALIAADDPNFYKRTPEQTARVYEFFKKIVDAMNSKALQNNNMREEDVRGLKDIFDPEKIKRPDLSFISLYISSCDVQPKAFYVRKLDEAASVLRIERALSKDTILLLYVNRIYLGRNLFGVSAASQAYFGKRVKDLSLAETAFIAGLPKAPNKFSHNTELGLKRRNEVLDAMAQAGKITLAQAAAAKAEPLNLIQPRASP